VFVQFQLLSVAALISTMHYGVQFAMRHQQDRSWYIRPEGRQNI